MNDFHKFINVYKFDQYFCFRKIIEYLINEAGASKIYVVKSDLMKIKNKYIKLTDSFKLMDEVKEYLDIIYFIICENIYHVEYLFPILYQSNLTTIKLSEELNNITFKQSNNKVLCYGKYAINKIIDALTTLINENKNNLLISNEFLTVVNFIVYHNHIQFDKISLPINPIIYSNINLKEHIFSFEFIFNIKYKIKTGSVYMDKLKDSLYKKKTILNKSLNFIDPARGTNIPYTYTSYQYASNFIAYIDRYVIGQQDYSIFDKDYIDNMIKYYKHFVYARICIYFKNKRFKSFIKYAIPL